MKAIMHRRAFMHTIASGTTAAFWPARLHALSNKEPITCLINAHDIGYVRSRLANLRTTDESRCRFITVSYAANPEALLLWLQSNKAARVIALISPATAIGIHSAYAFYFGLPAPYDLPDQLHAQWLREKNNLKLFAELHRQTGIRPLAPTNQSNSNGNVATAERWLHDSGVNVPDRSTTNRMERLFRRPLTLFVATNYWSTAQQKDKQELKLTAQSLTRALAAPPVNTIPSARVSTYETRSVHHLLKAVIAEFAASNTLSQSISESYFAKYHTARGKLDRQIDWPTGFSHH